MERQTGSGRGPRITNTAVDCTAEYLIQIGILQGDLNVNLRVDAPDDDAPLFQEYDIDNEPTKIFNFDGDEDPGSPRPKFDFDDLKFGANFNKEKK